MTSITVCFKLDEKDDQDLLNWLSKLPQGNKSAAIRALLRAGLGAQAKEVTLDTLYRKLSAIEQKLKTGSVVTTDANADAAEPPELAAALDALAEL